MTAAKKSIYQRLADARAKFHSLKITKTGHNKFAGYKYFELADFLIPGLECLREEGLTPIVTFNRDQATMTVIAEDGDSFTITSPMAEANLKGCHPIQNLGATQTYQRRYLWMALLEIVEHDQLDSAPPAEEPQPAQFETLAALKDHIEACDLNEAQVEYFKKHPIDSLTEQQAQTILKKMKEAA